MLKKLTIKTRLILVLVFLAAQLLLGALIGITNLGIANQSIHSLYNDRLVPLSRLDQMIRLLNANQLNLSLALAAEPDAAATLMREVDTNAAAISALWSDYMASTLTAEEAKLAEQFASDRARLLETGIAPAVAAIRGGDRERATALFNGPVRTGFVPVRHGVDALIALQLAIAKADFQDNDSTYLFVRNICIAGMLGALLVSAVVGYRLVRAIVPPLERAVEFAEAVASGDLRRSLEPSSRDEIGRLFVALKRMNAGLVGIVADVRTGAESIATASAQIACGNLDLSSRTEQQASALEETASSMEELTSTVRQNADNAQQANMLAQSASQVAIEGGAVVEDVVRTMASISASSNKIADIISVIDGIAFQTNILALNAAVEAARAGEQGRGFAVVASEVRSLAQRSANAAREIKALIGDSVGKVQEGAQLVGKAGSTMHDIVERVRRVTDIMGEITAASKEQSGGIEQINQAIAEMEDVTQQNASLVEEAAAAAHALEDQTTGLVQLVSVFRLAQAPAAKPSLPSPPPRPAPQRAAAPPRIAYQA